MIATQASNLRLRIVNDTLNLLVRVGGALITTYFSKGWSACGAYAFITLLQLKIQANVLHSNPATHMKFHRSSPSDKMMLLEPAGQVGSLVMSEHLVPSPRV